MPEFGGEGIEELADHFAQLSERQAANVRVLREEIERRRGEAREQGRNFAAPTGAQILDRLQSARSPMFSFIAWGGPTASPGTINMSVGIFNPDPVGLGNLFVHVFIGPASLVADVGQALALVDTRFPRLTGPPFGLVVNASGTVSLDFSIEVPAAIGASSYLANAFLFFADFFGSGAPLDRASFVFEVT